MKKKITILTIITLTIFMVIGQQNQFVHSNGSGAPVGNTGSPFDNKTCARSGCHSGTASFVSGLITSNIPPSGYIPGVTYTITNTCTQAGINKWGFQVSPMNNAGTLLGTPVITNITTTKLVGGSKYVTHTSSGTAGSGTKTWTFNWIAPAAGTGSVTFYGAFNFANANNMASGDLIRTSNLTVTENTTGINETSLNQTKLTIYPNPVNDKMSITYELESNGEVFIVLSDTEGKMVVKRKLGMQNRGVYTQEINELRQLDTGIYYVTIYFGNEQKMVKKMIKI